MEELDLTLPAALGADPLGEIRPEIQALILRGDVEISEVENFKCSKLEADALIESLTDDSLARRLDRILVNIRIPHPPTSDHEQNLWNLYNATLKARKRLERKESHSSYDNLLAAKLTQALAAFGPPTRPGISYLGAMHIMAQNSVIRLSK